MSQNILRNLTSVQTEGVGTFLESNMTVEKWITLAEKDWESAVSAMNSWEFDHLDTDDGWYRLYKVIISKSPEQIRHVQAVINVARFPIRDERRRLSDQQYNELCELAGDAYTQWKNEPIEKARRIKQAQEQFLQWHYLKIYFLFFDKYTYTYGL